MVADNIFFESLSFRPRKRLNIEIIPPLLRGCKLFFAINSDLKSNFEICQPVRMILLKGLVVLCKIQGLARVMCFLRGVAQLG